MCARRRPSIRDAIWPDGVRAAAAWFQGDNDAGQVMWDPETGGGFDGLHADGVNLNQGAESTLALLSTLQHAQRFSACRNDFGAGRARHAEPACGSPPIRPGSSPDLFVPGQEGFEHQDSRRARCCAACWRWTRTTCSASLDDVVTRFGGRHRDLVGDLRQACP